MKNAAVLSLSIFLVTTGSGLAPGDALAAKKAKEKPRAAAAAKVVKEKAPPPASTEEIEKLKGTYKWGMGLDEVAQQIGNGIQERYVEILKKTATDPTANDRQRKMMAKEIKDIKKGYVKFEGTTTGYDVSIIDQEFAHRSGETMLAAKEDNATRYFFFADGKLYKMFIAFDKSLIQDKEFSEFGDLMQKRFGKAKEVEVVIVRKEQKTTLLDHYEWRSKAGDGLKLVDRSAFYGVYCMVVFDDKEEKRLAEVRKLNPKGNKREALVEAVLAGDRGAADANADVIDRITGKTYGKVSDAPPDIAVPSPTAAVKAPTPEEVNRPSETAAAAPSSPTPAPKKRKTSTDTDGLEL